ncbi:MAG: GC-type dockerin domain-anchored protein [Planctomycetota bacterium]|nr:GC-type dockerin domain-anchored protein [Planctomycetota bacterium]
MNALRYISIVGLAAGMTLASSDDNCTVVFDSLGDAVIRRTDPGNDGAMHPDAVLPDIVSMSVCAWESFDPVNDPYNGQVANENGAHLFRLDITFDGLVNPAGRVLGSNPDPFAYGPSPVIGFLDIDIDDDEDSGGELGTAAETRYLANISRFGIHPDGSWGDRAAKSRDDLDNSFYTTPQYERSGADFALVLCGCSDLIVVSEGGDGNGLFDAGETWIVQARLFERSQGYLEASAAFGGSASGLYDPLIDVRFSHDTNTDQTLVSMVWALDMMGAAQLTGQPEQAIDLNVANHTSVVEALQDIIDGADTGGFSGPGWDLVEQWEGETADDYLEPSEWRVTGLFGAPYLDRADGLYVWTDTAGDDELFGDGNGDEFVTRMDETLIRLAVYGADGTADDADGVLDGVWTLDNPGFNFSFFDLDGTMKIETQDIAGIRSLGDFNWDGTVNTQDFIAYLNAWVASDATADFNLNQTVDTIDFVSFLNAWVAG